MYFMVKTYLVLLHLSYFLEFLPSVERKRSYIFDIRSARIEERKFIKPLFIYRLLRQVLRK